MSSSVESKVEDALQEVHHAFELTIAFLNENVYVGKALQEYLSNDQQLQLYGLYKQSTASIEEDDSAPSWWNARRWAKLSAWRSVSHLNRGEAMELYLKRLLQYTAEDRRSEDGKEFIPQQIRTLHSFVLGLLNERTEDVTQSMEANEQKNLSESGAMRSRGSDSQKRHALLETISVWLESLLTKTLGVVPLQSRGQLDISYQDLRFALYQCLRLSWNSSASRTRQLYDKFDRDIQTLWLDALRRSAHVESMGIPNDAVKSERIPSQPGVVVGLSVRTLLDLYLRVQQFPEGSEVIVSPPINVPGMMHVFRHHGLKLVGVDLAPTKSGEPIEISVNVDAIEKAITANSVAILIVHVFGMIVATEDDMKSLRSLVEKMHGRSKKIAILEDCAECFTGLDPSFGGYLGSPFVDVSFFSFGLIKTLTALNGGVAVVWNRSNENHGSTELLDSMTRLHNSNCYEPYVSNSEYAQRVCKCLVLRFISDAPLLYGLLFAIVTVLGFDFDSLVTGLLRGFHHGLHYDGRDSRVIHQIRRKPSVVMLALLQKRLRQKRLTSIRRRIEFCEQLTDRLLKQNGDKPADIAIMKSKHGCKNFFWLYPVCVKDPAKLSIHLRQCGFDATRGTSQLCCVSPESCPVARTLMNDILYIPIHGCGDVSSRGRFGPHEIANAVELNLVNKIRYGKKRPFVSPVEPKMRIGLLVLSIMLLAATLSFPLWMLQLFVWSMILYTIAMWLLRWIMGEFYLQTSKGLASHFTFLYDSIGDDHFQRATDSAAPIDSIGLLSSMKQLTVPSLYSRKEQRSVFLTGVTGYVGSMMLRDLMFYRKELGIDRIVLLCRAKNSKSASCRASAILEHDMYSFIPSMEKSSLVEVVDGDISMSNAGLSDAVIDELSQNSNFTHFFHCAASVSFTQSLPEAATANILSTLNVQNLSTRLSKEKVQFVYVSTAFVHGGRFGNSAEPLPEELCDLAQFDPFEIYRSMMGTQYYASMAMHELSFPNTYTFSKCISEHLLIFNDPTALIIRPSIVGPAMECPHEGWAGRAPSTLVAAACLYLNFQWNMWSFGRHRVPHIPIDVLTRFIIAKAFTAQSFDCTEPCPIEEASSDESFEKVSRCLSEQSSSLSSDSDEIRKHQIFNATWDVRSSKSSSFTWFEYAGAVTQVGSVFGYFSRPTAYLGLLFATRIVPKAGMSTAFFETVHKLAVKSPFEWTIRFYRCLGYNVKHLETLYMFLDLPLLFYPFMNNSYYFQSELTAPLQLDGERYLVNCVAAAHRFTKKANGRLKRNSQSDDEQFPDDSDFFSLFSVKGRKTMDVVTLFYWAISQPRGNIAVRFVGWLLALILPRCFSEVTVDLKSFSAMQRIRRATGTPAIVLVPTHRSIFDFLLLSFVCFSIPELQIPLPYIAAADIFERLPLVGWLLPLLGAFFVRRGRKSLDSCLADTVSSLKHNASNADAVVEVFIEGTRSRDRRFVSPKTGVLRCLQDPIEKRIVVPVTISYERIAEQDSFVSEVSGGQSSNIKVGAMLSWFISALQGKVRLGSAHIVACEPLSLEGDTDLNVLVNEVQMRQAASIFISEYHVKATSDVLGLESLVTRRAFDAFGVKFMPEYNILEEELDPSANIAVLLQVSPFLAPLFTSTRPKWSQWLCPFSLSKNACTEELSQNSDVAKLTEALLAHFDAADQCVDAAMQKLKESGFLQPQRHHVLQVARQWNDKVPALLLRAAIDIKWSNQEIAPTAQDEKQKRGTVVAPSRIRVGSDEALGYWGYHDAQFVLHVDGHGRTVVRFEEENRRSAPSKRKHERCSGLLPFIAQETGIAVNPLKVAFSDSNSTSLHEIPPCRIQGAEFEALKETIPNLSIADTDRIRHGTGHSQDDVFRIRSPGGTSSLRVPDVVVWPVSEVEVETLIRLAQTHHWCIIPYGGGTNVSNALQCPSLEVEPRPIVSLDMRRMCRILHIDEDNQVAHIEAGITGRHLEAQLASRGYTLGHAPDSLEFSTLGGWIATKASGMKRNKYGNIEDIVRGVRVVGPNGVLYHGWDRHVWGRESSGSLELKNLVLGSEGCLGVITSAMVRIWPLPKVQDYDGIVLSDFEEGLRFVRELSKLGAASDIPVSVRLLDNDHFRLGMALRPDTDSVWTSVAHWCGKELLKWSHRFDETSMVCVTLVYEGTAEEVQRQRRAVQRLRVRYGGVSLGSASGKAGYDLTFRIAYLRDFALSYHFLSDSFETFAPWSQISEIVACTKAVLRHEHAKRCLPGRPFIGCRVTQLYHEGVCLYFYFCMNIEGVERANEVFSAIEHSVRQEILSLGGSLSHHHGVGKMRASFLKEIDSVPFQTTLQSIKQSMDPDNIFGARNGSFALDHTL